MGSMSRVGGLHQGADDALACWVKVVEFGQPGSAIAIGDRGTVPIDQGTATVREFDRHGVLR